MLFCTAFSVSPFPSSLDTVCCYAQFLSRSFSSVQSIKNYLSGLKLVHVLMGLQFPHLSHFELRLVLKGLKTLNPFIPRQALPITPSIMLDMFRVLDTDTPFGASLWCAFVLALWLFARKSNIVPPSNNKFDKSKHLCRRDLILGPNEVLVYLKWSKTNQSRDRYVLIPLVKVPSSPLCPWSAVKNMVDRVPSQPDSPAFLVPSHKGLVSLTHSSFTSQLRQCLGRAGHNPRGYSGHSFRRGGASFALSCGVPGELIRTHGDWKSQCYLRYLDSSVQDRARVSQMMAAHLG